MNKTLLAFKKKNKELTNKKQAGTTKLSKMFPIFKLDSVRRIYSLDMAQYFIYKNTCSERIVFLKSFIEKVKPYFNYLVLSWVYFSILIFLVCIFTVI